MKARRSLNLLVAAAGLVFLSGCATETLTDSAFWSYLPFGSSQGGKGSGGQGGKGADQPKSDPTSKGQTTDGANPTAPTRSTDPISEGWNDPVAPKKDAGASLPQAKPSDASKAPQTPAPRHAVEEPKGPTHGGPAPAIEVPAAAPALPALAGRAPEATSPGTMGLPTPDGKPHAAKAQDAAHLADSAGPSPVNRPDAPRPRLPESPAPMGKGQRSPIRLPELIVDGSGSAAVGQPNLAEAPKGTLLPTPAGSLNLPREIVGPAATANLGQDARRLPQALTETPQRAAPVAAALPLPGFPAEGQTRKPGQASPAGSVPNPSPTTATNRGGPAIMIPGAPATQAPDGRTLTSGVAGGPLAPKANGPAAPLPTVGPNSPLPSTPIPAPFRLSEWISDDAMHQAWRRRQSQRAQLEPEIRGGEQQRLRLLLDTYLLREKPVDKAEK